MTASVAGGGPAAAQDTWTDPRPGVRHLYRRTSGPRDIHALVVDLCHAGVSGRATREIHRRATVPAWADARGVDFATNGDFFSFSTYSTSGVAMGNGVTWGSADSRAEGFVAFGRDRVYLSPNDEVVDPLPDWMRQVVSGKPSILVDGEIVTQTSALCTARHPRTAVGLSRDRHTLFMMVVDGRSARSIGMTCAEEAGFLRELGAWDAINLDGGGSSTMWVRGRGVVNRPSDGSPRIVANHLGIVAAGSGVPTSCMPYEPEEDALAAGALATSTTDLDDDGRADLCVRAAAGIRCALANGAPFGEIVVGPALGDGRGWSDRTNYETLAMGDVTGDGLADVCARANAGVRCWPSTGAGFDDAIVGPELSDAVGWSRPEHYATIRLADVDGDDRDDVCARAAAGFVCWPSTGTGFAAGWAPVAALSNDAGFAAPDRWATIRMGDVDGDGRDDVCARGAGGFDCWRSNGSGFDATPIEGPRWGDGHWRSHSRYSTIRMGDVDGDGRDDACARGALGYRCHLATGSGFGDAIVLEALSNDRGWTDITNYSTIHLADVDGDRDLDVCARGDRGILCWPFEGSGFGAETTGPELSDDSGWARPIYYRTIRFADIDGDGDDDLCARAAAGIRCWLADGGRFGEGLVGPEWSDEAGFWPLRHHTTMRLAGPVRAFVEPPPPEGDGGPSGDAGPTLGPSDDAGRPRSDAAGPEPSRGPGAGPTSGCACSTSGPASPWPIWSLLVMAGAWRKRR